MTIERNPVAYGDIRGWIDALRAAGEIREVDAEVDWNIEIGTVMRLAQGTGDGPALLFNTIKDYGANARCRSSSAAACRTTRRVAHDVRAADRSTHHAIWSSSAATSLGPALRRRSWPPAR